MTAIFGELKRSKSRSRSPRAFGGGSPVAPATAMAAGAEVGGDTPGMEDCGWVQRSLF